MKPGKNDFKAKIKFEMDELELLQGNAWQMADAFGLDTRICNLTGKRAVGFYSWDLECIEEVAMDLQKDPETKEIADRITLKVEEGFAFIEAAKKQ